ncbi:hypothetical protein [Saccharopolyspora phatthalungensis]|uniref:Uncharacterized protein n=1 Tax=Saccharopolyspora phatthalungensis TaxID=664693 RepID=A0A840QAX9_9PSEU|nr:hypothetical protein [Saccharopolyspora phatthalungensis]MBB5156970.1 hypothetical protein [Saccharopolyspora phatthalungensis]
MAGLAREVRRQGQHGIVVLTLTSRRDFCQPARTPAFLPAMLLYSVLLYSVLLYSGLLYSGRPTIGRCEV